MDLTEERRRHGLRITSLQYGAVAVFVALAVSFWMLQIAQHRKYLEMERDFAADYVRRIAL